MIDKNPIWQLSVDRSNKNKGVKAIEPGRACSSQGKNTEKYLQLRRLICRGGNLLRSHAMLKLAVGVGNIICINLQIVLLDGCPFLLDSMLYWKTPRLFLMPIIGDN